MESFCTKDLAYWAIFLTTLFLIQKVVWDEERRKTCRMVLSPVDWIKKNTYVFPRGVTPRQSFVIRYRDDGFLKSHLQEHHLPFHKLNAAHVNIEEDAVGILHHPAIQQIHPDYEVRCCSHEHHEVNNEKFHDLSVQRIGWHVGRVKADVSQSFSGSHCYVLDTGGSYHPDLNIAESKSFVLNESSTDDNAHSTMVSGIIGAINNSIGMVGISPSCQIHCMRVLDRHGSGTVSSILAALNYVCEQGVVGPKVINCSFCASDGTSEYTVLDNVIKQCTEKEGMIFVIAAGNDGKDASQFTPSKVKEAIVVGAYDETNTQAYFSNYGQSVTLFAPGTRIESTSLHERYSVMSGTSFSAPIVTAAVCRLLARDPSLDSSIKIKNRLLQNTTSNVLSLNEKNLLSLDCSNL